MLSLTGKGAPVLSGLEDAVIKNEIIVIHKYRQVIEIQIGGHSNLLYFAGIAGGLVIIAAGPDELESCVGEVILLEQAREKSNTGNSQMTNFNPFFMCIPFWV